MALLADWFMGKSGQESQHGRSSTDQATKRTPLRKDQQDIDLLRRWITSQMTEPPETVLSTPTQQYGTTLQAMAPLYAHQVAQGSAAPQTMAQRLSGHTSGAPVAGVPADATFTPGKNQFGLQSRKDFGMKAPEEYAWAVPDREQIEQVGLPGVATPGKNDRLATVQQDIGKVENRIERRTAKGLPHQKADAKLANLKAREVGYGTRGA